jgi:hypothetical protein
MKTEEVTGKPHSVEDLILNGDAVYLKNVVFPMGTIVLEKDILERTALLILQYSLWSTSAEQACQCCSKPHTNRRALLSSCRVMKGEPMWGGCLSCALQGSMCSFTSSAPPHKYREAGAANEVNTIPIIRVISANADFISA